MAEIVKESFSTGNSFFDFAKRNFVFCENYERKFNKIFAGRYNLRNSGSYWHYLYGFDLIEFCEDIGPIGDNESCMDRVVALFGEEAASLLNEIILLSLSNEIILL
jgi:hypothetical protein